MKTLKNFDINRRADGFLDILKGPSDGAVSATIRDLLPLLSLHKKTASLGALGILASRTIELNLRGNKARSFFQMTASVAYIGFSALAPLPCLALSFALKAYGTLTSCDPALKKITLVAHQAIYVASAYYATPALIALSLACQTVAELYEATNGFRERPSSLKDIVSLIVACARLSQVHFHAKKAYLTYFDRELTKKKWNKLIAQVIQDPKIEDKTSYPLEELLKNKHFSDLRVVEGVTLTYYGTLRPYTIYKSCIISPDFYQYNTFTKSLFDNCCFKQPLDSKVHRATFNEIVFNHCNLSSAVFTECIFKNASFNRCNLSCSTFVFSHFFNTSIISSNLENTSFWDNTIQESVIRHCSLVNALFLEAKKWFNFKDCDENYFTKPIILMPTHIAVPVNLRFAPFIKKSLHQKAALVLSVDVESRKLVDVNLLRQEVLETLKDIEECPSPTMLSRADEILKRAKEGSQLNRIKERASALMGISHGLVIPGGKDIEKEFYKPFSDTNSFVTKNKIDFTRTLTELTFLKLAHERNIPVLGICRGSQLINVFFGGDLHNVEPQDGNQELSFAESSSGKQLEKELKYTTPFIGYSCHHQAANVLGQGLEVVLKFKDIIKLLIHKNGSIIGCQFHPEQILEEEAKGNHPSSQPQTGIYRFFIEKVMNVYNKKLLPIQGV